jgi:glyoxylase-like metal-dependent hydrolase (beta-lactamase superfamily II)
MRPTVTYVGAATLLLEIGGLRLLTDPALDPAGSEYAVVDPALAAAELGHIDAVLLSHDEHFDNLWSAWMKPGAHCDAWAKLSLRAAAAPASDGPRRRRRGRRRARRRARKPG